jgi:hypothetical protein
MNTVTIFLFKFVDFPLFIYIWQTVWGSMEVGKIAQLYRPSKFKDFLGSEPVELIVEFITNCMTKKVSMVTSYRAR